MCSLREDKWKTTTQLYKLPAHDKFKTMTQLSTQRGGEIKPQLTQLLYTLRDDELRTTPRSCALRENEWKVMTRLCTLRGNGSSTIHMTIMTQLYTLRDSGLKTVTQLCAQGVWIK